MHKILYVVSTLCLALVLVIPTLSNPPLSPAVLSGTLICTAFLLTAVGRALHLLGDLHYRLLAEE